MACIHTWRYFVFVLLVSTPDGASQLLEDVDSKVQHHNSSLVQGMPVYGPRTLQKTMDRARLRCHSTVVRFCIHQTVVSCKKLCSTVLFVYS